METIKVVEPRANVKADEQKNHVVLQGGLRYTEQVHPADSFGSVGTAPVQALWTIYPPSTQTIVDRLVMVRCYVEVEAVGANFFVGTYDAPRQFPITSMADVLTVQINGESISDNIGDKLHALLAYGNVAESRNNTWSQTCAMPDQFQQLADWQTYGSAKNPLANYGENSNEDPRGGFPYDAVAPNKLRYVFTEPILLSPFYDGLGGQVEGFVNVSQFNIAYRWKSDVKRLWSHATHGGSYTDLKVSFYQAPEILTTFITPDLTQPIPRLQTLPYHKTQDYIKSVPTMAVGERRPGVFTDSIKLSQIPRRIYLFCRKSRQSSTYKDADAFAGIRRVSVLWDNQSGLLNNMGQQQLYEMSKRNGLNMTYGQFSRYRGSVVCIEMGTNIGLLDNEASGVRGQHTLQIEVELENLSGVNWEGELYTLMLMEGTFQISENMGRATLGNLTPDVVLASKGSDEMDFNQYENLRGEGFFSSLKHFVNKVARGVQKGVDVAGPLVSTAFPELAGALPALSAGAKLAQGLSGGRLAGGSVMSRRGMRR